MNPVPGLEGFVVQEEEDLLEDVGDIFGEELIEATVLGGGHGDVVGDRAALRDFGTCVYCVCCLPERVAVPSETGLNFSSYRRNKCFVNSETSRIGSYTTYRRTECTYYKRFFWFIISHIGSVRVLASYHKCFDEYCSALLVRSTVQMLVKAGGIFKAMKDL